MIRHGIKGVLLLAACCAWALMQSAHAQGLPKGEEIVDKSLAATGGKEAYEKCKNRVAKGSMELAGLGVKGNLTIYAAGPNKTYVEVDLPGVGKIEEGCDGAVAWSNNPATGPRLKEGAEKTSALRQADFDGEVNWRKHYKKAECVGDADVEGKACYKLQMTTSDDQVKTHYYDKSSYLLLKATGTEMSPNGNLTVENLLSDYKKVDGLLIPFKTRQKVLTQEIVITLDKVEHNVKLPENRFDLPDEIKKLAEKEKK
jgi:Protein of unknown function (DUF620)